MPRLPIPASSRAIRPLRALVLLLAVMACGAAMSAEPYRLGPLDKVRLLVVEWQAGDGTSRDWSSLSGDYRIGPEGDLSLPYLGSVPAAGRSTHEVAATLGPLLQRRLGLVGVPAASIEIVEFRPFYVTGAVQQPGAYPYAPGMNIIKAIAVAGGLMRPDRDASTTDRAYITDTGKLRQAIMEANRLEAQRARLEAEQRGADEITFPEALKRAEGFEELARGERALMKAERDRLARQKASLANLQDLLKRELAALDRKATMQESQRTEIAEELDGLRRLAEKGLAGNQRVRGVSQTLAQVETNILNIESERFRARQELNKAERDAVALVGDREASIAKALQDTLSELRVNDQEARIHRSLAIEASAGLGSAVPSVDRPMPRYAILRKAQGAAGTWTTVARTAAIMPGDVVDVSLVIPSEVNQ